MAVPRILKGYELHEKIGGGGFGNVYRAYQPIVDRNVAIKIIKPEYTNDPDFIRSFEEEAHYVARLEHPHIIPLYDYWRDTDGAYLVMRYTQGGSLRRRLKGGLLPLDEINKIVNKIGDALSLSHRNHVIHRDLKPDNILIDDEGNPYLTDFGIARPSGRVPTSSVIVGSVEYMSPEQINGDTPSPAMDVYSFGIIIFELLAGFRPFSGGGFEIMQKQISEKLPNICEIRTDLNLRKTVDDVLQKACAKDASARYSDIRVLIGEFNDATERTGIIVIEPEALKAPLMPNPYKGLRAFEIEDERNFYGREGMVQKLAARLQEESPFKRFLAVVGPSGSGKSSVVKAGLIPALRKGIIPNSASWFIVQMVPGDRPILKLEAALNSVASHAPHDLYEQLSKNEFALAETTPRLLEGIHGDLLLFVDHFEELFTLVENPQEVNQFLSLLFHGLTRPNSRLWVIIAVRSDFYDSLILHPMFAQLLQERIQVVVGMSADELTQAIRTPAERVGLTVEANLIATIISDIANKPGTLPLLQYALTETFENRTGNRLTLAAYQQMGGIVGALSNRAETIYQGLSYEQQRITRQIFVRLVQPNFQDDITRRRVRRSDLVRLGQVPMVNSVLNTFEYYDLLTFDNELGSREPTVEVAHEAIFQGWQRLREWLEESLEDLRLEEWLHSATQEWLKSGRDSSYLAHGARLALLEEWAEKSVGELLPDEKNFLDSSVLEREQQAERELRQAQEAAALAQQVANEAQKAAEVAQQAAKAQRNASVRLGIAVVLLVAMVIGALVLYQNARSARIVAQQNEQTAQSLALASNAQIEFIHDNNDVALRLALAAAKIPNPPPVVQSILVDVAYAPGTVYQFDSFPHELTALALSHDGQKAIVGEGNPTGASEAYTTYLLNVSNNTIIGSIGSHEASIRAVAFSPDDAVVYSADENGYVAAWSVADDTVLWQIERRTQIRDIAISNDGHYMLIGAGVYDADADPKTAYAIWLIDTQTGATECELIGHNSPVYSVAFSPDDNTALSGSGAWQTSQADNTLRLWNLTDCTLLNTLSGHEDIIQDFAFSPDSFTAVTASADHTLIWWDLETGAILRRYGAGGEEGHTDWVNRVLVHPNGRWMLSGGWDNQLILWDLWTGDILHHFIGHTGPVNGIALSADGRLAYSVSADKTVRIWEITNALLQQRFDVDAATPMLRVRISPDAQTVVSGSTDGVLRLWDIATSRLLWDVQAHIDRIYALSFSPDGRYIVSGGSDQQLYLWETSTGERVRTFHGHTGRIWMVDYSPDNRFIVSGSDDQTVRVWEAATGNLVLRIDNLRDIYAVDFSPDNRYVLAGGIDAQLYLIDIEQQQVIHTFSGHIASINAIDFSPDGHYAVSGGYDNHLIVWDIANQRLLTRLEGHFGPIFGVEFSQDARHIISGASDRTIRIWTWQEGVEQGRISYSHSILSVDVAAQSQEVLIGSQGAVDLLRLPAVDTDELISWIHAHRLVQPQP